MVVPGRYVVVLLETDLEKGAEEQAQKLARIYGGLVKNVLWATFEIEMSEDEARALSRDPAVRFVAEKPRFGSRSSEGRFRRSTHPAPGVYMVTLRERRKFLSRAAIREIAEAITARHGGSVEYIYELTPGFSINATEAQAIAVSEDEEVDSVCESTVQEEDPRELPPGPSEVVAPDGR